MSLPALPVFLTELTPLDVCIDRMGSVRLGCLLAELEQRVVLRTQLSEAQGHRCCWCGRRFCDTAGSKASPTLEHVQPLSQGGANTPDNLAVACARCNHKRGVSTPAVFLAHVAAVGWMDNRIPSPWAPVLAEGGEPPAPAPKEHILCAD